MNKVNWGSQYAMTIWNVGQRTPVARPFESSYTNGMWLYDHGYTFDECKNALERAGWMKLHAAAK